MADMKFRVKAASENATKTVVSARGFKLIVDEPAELGGTNEGANPVEFLLAAYAGCLNVMAHIVAKEMDFQLDGVEINLVGELNPARVFGSSFEDRAGYNNIEVVIKPKCNEEQEVLDRWLEAIVSRCPVGDNIKNSTPVTVVVKK